MGSGKKTWDSKKKHGKTFYGRFSVNKGVEKHWKTFFCIKSVEKRWRHEYNIPMNVEKHWPKC